MINDLTSCVGGHFSESPVRKTEFERNFLNIDRQFGVEFARVINSKGFPIRKTDKSFAAMLRQETWELLGDFSGEEILPEYLRWNIALYVRFHGKKTMFIGIDPAEFKFDSRKRLEEIFEEKIITFCNLRYAYQFAQRRSSCPQCYVYGGSVMTSWQQMKRDESQDWLKLHRWWHARIFVGQEKRGVRDVFEVNYFLDTSENEFLEVLLRIAGSLGSICRLGQYFVWRVDKNDIPIARAELIARGLIGPPS